MRYRHNLYFDRDVTDALEQIARHQGGNKSRVVNDVLREWLAQRAASQVDVMFKRRLDLISREQKRGCGLSEKVLERIGYLLEALMLFVRYELTVTASLPEQDHAALAKGNERYERFLAQLGRQIAAGGARLAPDDEDGAGTGIGSGEPGAGS